ncbi:oxidoreductase HTATIP2-like [Mya arenaria]|uniref:oxidoreductase HTATIP2-like n=1 Tax=Mya arenaria TaxID=6604 RepID=UPI0022E0A427|nr:oxidoreductase HTATIP2-like [Mya arenaria]
MANAATRNVFVMGFTGKTGKAVVDTLAKDTDFGRIKLLGRRQVETSVKEDSRFEQYVVNYDKIEDHTDAFSGCEAGICCMGGSGGRSMPDDQYIKINLDYVINSAKVAKAAGCRHFLMVSATDSDKKSRVTYRRTKGIMEEQLQELGFERLTIVKPGYISGPRETTRFLDVATGVVFFPLIKLFPTKYSVPAASIALAMINCIKMAEHPSVKILENKDIHTVAKETKEP